MRWNVTRRCQLGIFIMILVISVGARAQCPIKADSIDGSQPKPSFTPKVLSGDISVAGLVLNSQKAAAIGTVALCVGKKQIGSVPAKLEDGHFNATSDVPLIVGQIIEAQYISADGEKRSQVVKLNVASPATPCSSYYNDCQWSYYLVGGVEQSDLSSQSSQTDGFIDLFTRGPLDTPGYLWLEARFLGAPNNSNTGGIATAITNPSGSVTASTLSTVGTAVDYVAGGGYRIPIPTLGTNTRRWTLDAIAAFGATTPLSSESASVAYAVPTYGTNECNLLQNRFTSSKGYGADPLPGSGSVVTTTVSNGTTTTTTSPTYCVVQPGSTTTTTISGGVTTTTTVAGTQITNIAFAPQNRTSFLLKYLVGARYTYRTSKTSGQCAEKATENLVDTCMRAIADFTLGQDEAITGGEMRRFVVKTNAVFPFPKVSGLYFFAAASIRLKKNENFPPLLLTQVPISTSTGSATSGTVTIPSPSVFVLPLKQSDRDFYRIGIALDLDSIFSGLKGN